MSKQPKSKPCTETQRKELLKRADARRATLASAIREKPIVWPKSVQAAERRWDAATAVVERAKKARDEAWTALRDARAKARPPAQTTWLDKRAEAVRETICFGSADDALAAVKAFETWGGR